MCFLRFCFCFKIYTCARCAGFRGFFRINKGRGLSGSTNLACAVSPRELGALAPLVRDAAFKRVFGNNDGFAREALRDLINAMEVLDGAKVAEVASIEPSEQPEFLEGRTIIYDVMCTLDNGDRVVIELQKAPMRTLIVDRMVGYVARQYDRQWSKGGKTDAGTGTYALKPVHALALLDFQLDKVIDDAGDMIQHYSVLPRAGSTKLSKSLSARLSALNNYTFVQLPLAPPPGPELATASPAELWAHLIRYSGTYKMETLPRVFKDNKVFKTVAELVRYASMEPAEIAGINAEEDYLKQLASTVGVAEQDRDAAVQRAATAEQRAASEASARVSAEQRAASEASARVAAEQRAAAAEQRTLAVEQRAAAPDDAQEKRARVGDDKDM